MIRVRVGLWLGIGLPLGSGLGFGFEFWGFPVTDVIHTAGRVYKKSVTMHTAGREQILTLTLTLAVCRASFVYTYGRPCV